MAKGNLAACLKVTLVHEGGWSDHPADPGGATMKGVTIGRYREHYPNATKADLRAITDADLQRIYRDDYWNKVRGEELPFGVDLATFDFGVNSGPSRGARYLQAVLGIKQTGTVGNETVAAALKADGKATIQKLCARRLSFVQVLPRFKTFGRGWTRRYADVEAKAVAMWLARGGTVTASVRKELNAESGKASKVAKSQTNGAGGTVILGGSGTVASNPDWLLIGCLVAGIAIVAGVLIFKARQNRDRADAYAAEAAAAT